MTHQAIQTTFDDWVETGRADLLESSHKNVAEQVITRMDIRPGFQSLDMGCGTGWATRLLGKAAPGATAVGVDCSPAMIRRAEELHDLTSRARYMVSNMEAVDFKEGRFDRIFSMGSLSYSPDPSEVLREAHRLTKSGGEAHFLTGRYKECAPSERWADAIGLPMAWLSAEEWCAALEGAGFVNVQAARVRTSDGPGEEATFKPDDSCPDWSTHLAIHAAGFLWLKGQRT